MTDLERSFIEGGMLENVSGVEGWREQLETLAMYGVSDESAQDDEWNEAFCRYVIGRLIAAVREDERQKMFDLWRGMLP